MNNSTSQSWAGYHQGQCFPRVQLEQGFELPAYNYANHDLRYPGPAQPTQPQQLEPSRSPTIYDQRPIAPLQSHSYSLSSQQSSSLDKTFAGQQQQIYGVPSSSNQSATAVGQTAFVNRSPARIQQQGLPMSNLPMFNTPDIQQKKPSPIQPLYDQRVFTAQPQLPRSSASPDRDRQPVNKRARQRDEPADEQDRRSLKHDSSRACTNCAKAKVKCVFIRHSGPCERCTSKKCPCFILPRRERARPPKREIYINEIQRQAGEIKALISQLEALGARAPFAAAEDGMTTSVDPGMNEAVADWLAKARESLEIFGGFIADGEISSFATDLESGDLSNDEGEDSEEGMAMEAVESSGIDIIVERTDGNRDPQLSKGSRLHRKLSASSLGSAATGASMTARRKTMENSANLLNEAAPFGLFSDLKRSLHPTEPGEADDKNTSGIAGRHYFEAGPNPIWERLAKDHQPPYILSRGLITPTEAEKLFKIYFEKMNISLSLLDPVLYTPQGTYFRSPFLFTVICAIASRFYTERPELYPQALHFAQLAAGTALISGKKNVEMCAAYILLGLYPIPVKRLEDQRSWLYLGLAIRCAIDMNLHLPITARELNEAHAREMLNRTRMWLNCYNLDRSTGSQYGKPQTIPDGDYVATHCEDWWRSSAYNLEHFDIHICAYNAELRVMASFMAKIFNKPGSPSGLSKEVDLETIAIQTDDELQSLGQKWFGLLENTDMTDPQNSFRKGLLRLAYSYSRLGCLSYGFQRAFAKNQYRENPFLIRCLNAATDVLNAMLHDICKPNQVTYIMHGPEAQSVFVTFASAFLIKLLQPKFAPFLTQEKRAEIQYLVQQIIDLLGSQEIAVDDRHGPKLYSRFLGGLLSSTTSMASAASRKVRSPTPSKPHQIPQILKTENGYLSIESSPAIPPPQKFLSDALAPTPTSDSLFIDSFPLNGHVDSPAIYANSLLFNTFDLSPSGELDMVYDGSDGDAFKGQVFDTNTYHPGSGWMVDMSGNLGINIRNAAAPAEMYNHSFYASSGVY